MELEAGICDWPENREHARHPQNIDASLFNPHGGQLSSRTEVLDLSQSGFAISSPLNLNIGDSLQFKLPLPRNRNVRGVGAIRWAKSSGRINQYGLEIVEMGYFDRQNLGLHLKPRNQILLKWLDLSLQYSFLVTILFFAKNYLEMNANLQDAIIGALPVLGVVFGVFISIYLYFKGLLQA